MNKRAFISLSVAIFVAMLGMSIISPLMATYAREMGASGLWLSASCTQVSLSREP